MKPTADFLLAFVSLLVLTAEPALAQSIDLSPIQSLLQGPMSPRSSLAKAKASARSLPVTRKVSRSTASRAGALSRSNLWPATSIPM